MPFHKRSVLLVIVTACVTFVVSLIANQHAPTFNDAVIAIQLIGFAPVAFLIITLGLGSIIVWAIGYFISRLGNMSDRIANGQSEVVAEMRVQSKLLTVLGEDLRMLIMQQSHTQENLNATKSQIEEHRSVVEHS